MSRIGRMPIAIPSGVEVKVGAGNEVTVKGTRIFVYTDLITR